MLQGPVGAPAGLGIAVGGYSLGVPRGMQAGTVTGLSGDSGYTTSGGQLRAIWMSASYEHRYLATALDGTFGWGTLNGTVQGTATSFQESAMASTFTLRVGARLPLRYLALAVGSGIGGSLWFEQPQADATAMNAIITKPSSGPFFWHLPFWAAATVKPLCDWGIQALASYQLEPNSSDGNTFGFGVGLVWQPSPSCSQAAEVRVVPLGLRRAPARRAGGERLRVFP